MQIKKYPISFFDKSFQYEKSPKVKQRLQLLIYLRENKDMRTVAELLRISLGSVSYWKQRFERENIVGLQDKNGRGRKSKLNKKQLKELSFAIDNGIKMKDGYKRGFKTKDVREFIQNKFGVGYTTRNCLKILHRLGYNLKVPRPRNKSRNQNSVEQFKKEFKKNSPVWTKTR